MQCNEQNINSRQQKKLAYRARNRLLSIHHDAQNLKDRVYDILESSAFARSNEQQVQSFPWLPNKNCGTWYLPPEEVSTSTEVYFKSSDGHITSNYSFSLKRLNLPLIELLNQVNSCFLIDSSVRKTLPDSFSRTIPIWCCVMNRIVQRYRADLQIFPNNNQNGNGDETEWDTSLYTPASIVSKEEYEEISSLIDSRVELLYSSKAIVNPSWLVNTLIRPLRPMWIAEGQVQNYTNSLQESRVDEGGKYYTIICCNPSDYHDGSSSKNHIHWKTFGNNDNMSFRYYYTPGAADDDSEWGRNLTPELFWFHGEKLLKPNLTDDDTDNLIDEIVQQSRSSPLICNSSNEMKYANKIGLMNLWIGSFEAAWPQTCWDNFDAILNVTDTEYPDTNDSIRKQQNQQRKCFYLQLPVAQGKKDRAELERFMPVGLVFLIHHLQQNRRVLVHGTKGRDRAVAIVLALAVFVCPATYPLVLKDNFMNLDIGTIARKHDDHHCKEYFHSDLRTDLVNVLLEKEGRETFLQWMHSFTSSIYKPFADKESLRIVLQLVTRYREAAEPTRSTMQKLNRFFMSSSIYRTLKVSNI